MRFNQIEGNEEFSAAIASMIDEGRLGHAVLLQEQPGGGGLAYALAIAQYINCRNHSGADSCGTCPSCYKFQKLIHPDLHFAFPVNSSQKVSSSSKNPVSDMFLPYWRELVLSNPYFTEQDLSHSLGIDNKQSAISVFEAKQIINSLSLRSYEAENKIMIIWQPEKMNVTAANKLLKLLEEPPAGTIFLLVSQSPEKLLSTIISRCRKIVVPAPTRMEEEISEYDDLLFDLMEASLSHNMESLYPVWTAVSLLGKDKQRDFCVCAEGFVRKMLMSYYHLDGISYINEDRRARFSAIASRVKPDFYIKASAALDRAIRAVDSNVNAKLIFCDLCNRFFLYA